MSSRGTRSRSRRILNFTPKQLKSLREDGKYKNRHIFAFSDMGSNYNDIKETENDVRLDNPDMSQKQIIAKTMQIIKKENGLGPRSTPTSSLGTRRSRRGSRSRSRRGSRRGSSSSGTRRSRSRSRSRRGSSSSGTRRSRSRPRSLHNSDL